MEKENRPQSQSVNNKPNQNRPKNSDAPENPGSTDNESLLSRLGGVNVMPDGMLSAVDETDYVNSIINDNAKEVNGQNNEKNKQN